MAARCCCMSIPLVRKPARCQILIPKQQSQIPVVHPTKSSTGLQISSSSTIRNKVFEDGSNGIVCYRDDFGEIICEGYDEGPRLHLQFPLTSSYRVASSSRDFEVVKHLQKAGIN